MEDRYGRRVDYLRIAVTSRCNLSCPYCHHEGEEGDGGELSPDFVSRVLDDLVPLGVRKVKITGGEPLLHPEIVEIVRRVADFPEIVDISMTTNGTLLQKLAYPLKEAGLNRVNIGCDSFTSVLPKNLREISPSLRAAREAGLSPIKLNMVVLKGINENEVEPMIEYARKEGVILQLIELIDIDHSFFKAHYYNLSRLEEELARRARRVVVRRMQARRQYDIEGVLVEVVRPHQPEFCRNCTKLRITSKGMIKPCLMRNDNLVPYTGISSVYEALSRREPYYAYG